jgi:hypothetical protein
MWITKLNRDAIMAQVSSSVDSFYGKLCEIFKVEIKAKKIEIIFIWSIRKTFALCICSQRRYPKLRNQWSYF